MRNQKSRYYEQDKFVFPSVVKKPHISFGRTKKQDKKSIYNPDIPKTIFSKIKFIPARTYPTGMNSQKQTSAGEFRETLI